MRKLYKLATLLLALAMLFSTVSCNKVPNPDDDDGGNTDTAKLSESEFIDALAASEFSDSGLTDTVYGLSDAANVGVKEQNYDDCLYPVPADSECDEIIVYSEFASEETEDYGKLLEVFAAAKAFSEQGKTVKIKLPESGLNVDCGTVTGTYAFSLDGYDGLYIEGNDTLITLSYGSMNYKGFLSVTNSSDVYIQGVKLDYEIPTALTGVITASDEENLTVTISVYEEFNPLVKRIIASNSKLLSVVQFSSITSAPAQDGNFATSSEGYIGGYTVEGDEENGYTITVRFSAQYSDVFNKPSKGDYLNLAFSMYSYNGYSFSNCRNVHVEDVTVYTCPGMGFVAIDTENLYVNRFRLTLREDTNRMMTATADGLHLKGLTGTVKVTNCLIENTHDDALNIKTGYYYTLTGQDIVNKTVTIQRKTESIAMPEAGDVLEFYDEESFELRAALTVVGVTGNSMQYTVTVKESLIKLDMANWGTTRVTNVSDNPDFEFSNNIIRNKRNRGILCQVRGALISNNTFENVGHGAISIHSSLDVFNEATMPRDITVVNNKLINNNYLKSLPGDIAVFAQATTVAPSGTITGITVKNNFITDNGNAGIALHGVGDSEISDNLIVNPARTVVNSLFECALELNNTGDIVVKGNYVVKANASDTYAGIIPSGMTDTKTITLSDNKNLELQNLAGETVVYEVRKINSGSITIDGNLSDWENVGLDIEMVGYSIATGDEIEKTLLDEVFRVEACKIAWTDEGLYVAFEVYDNKLDFKTQNNFWNGDCFEMFMTTVLDMPNADLQLLKTEGATLQMAMVPTWTSGFTLASVRTSDEIVNNSGAMQVKVVKNSDGYAGEAFMPFTALSDVKDTIDSGNALAMAFVLADNDRDDIGRKRVQVGNVEHFVEAWKTKTARMPQYLFVD
ncbi:MAG: sugar-binding protein [Christensenellales bacterium]